MENRRGIAMTPKKSTSLNKKSSVAKKPSPRKMSRSPISSTKSKKKKISETTKKLKTNTLQTSPENPVTPEMDSSLSSPRSSERYNFRNITPPSYKLNVRYTPARTPLRTPAGMLQRTPAGMLQKTPARKLGRTPMATPFRTPRIRPLESESQSDPSAAFKLHREEAVTWKEHLKLLTSRIHKLCYLSSMSNFRYGDKLLRKKYENFLKNKVLEVYPSAVLTVSLSTTSCLTLQPKTVDAVRIEINSLSLGNTTDEDVDMNVYSAWLFRSSKTQSQSFSGLEWFPVMFYTGREVIHHVVMNWLQGSFGCYVSRYGIRQNDLMWIAGVWSGRLCPLPSHQSRKHLMVDFVYHIHPPFGTDALPDPNHKGKPRIAVSISLKDIQHVWTNIVDSSSDQMKEEDLTEYFSTINSFAERLTQIPMYLLQLYRLQTPCINLSADGKVRVPCSRSVKIIVNHLIDIFLQILDIDNDDESTKETSDVNGELSVSVNNNSI
ncbi:centromere protein L-like isoform X2 [Macrobrachium rosenbergii]|uniref:centromere protein L-like isoform X2 n=1 Tax=Macrobrachium rosenbergii TaxID=79674 RepID=UPI0034D57091